jgi:hypothetical protein
MATKMLGPSRHNAVFRGGAGEEDYNNFMKEKNDNLKLIALIKHYEEIYDHIEMKLNELLNYINNGIKFLNDNRDKIIIIIDGYKYEELSKAEAMILISTIKKVLFTNIFENYFLEIIANMNPSETPDNLTDIITALSITSDNISLTKKINEIKATIDAFKSYKTTDTAYKRYFSNKRVQIDKEPREKTQDEDAKAETIAALNKAKADLDEAKAEAKAKAEAEAAKKKKVTNVLNSDVDGTIIKDIATEKDNNKENLKKIFVEIFKLQETAYWWKEVEQTIEKELDTDNAANGSYKRIINIFLKEMLQISIGKELDLLIINDNEDNYKEYLENLQKQLNNEPKITPLSTYEGGKKESYGEIIAILNNSSAIALDQEPPTSTKADITKADMKRLTNSMISLLKFQIYYLYKKYKDILDTCDLGKIKEEIDEFKITFKDEKPTTSQPPHSSRPTLAI